MERAVEALRHGNAPRKALEHYLNGDQDLPSVTRSVLLYHRKDPKGWEEALEAVLEAIEELHGKDGE